MRRALVVAPLFASLIFSLTVRPLQAAGHLQPFVANAHALPGGRQVLTLRRQAERIELRDAAGSVVASQRLDATSSVIINGSSGDDTLIVDFTNGNPIPGGLEFNGGAEVTPEGDLIAVTGGSFEKVVVDYTSRSDGTISLDGTLIRYAGLEPMDISGVTIADLVLVLPANSNALLQDSGTPTDNKLLAHSVTGTFEDTIFSVPTNSLSVNTGAGTNLITTSADFSGDFDAGLSLNGGAGTDTMTLGPLALTTGSATLAVTAETININGGTITTSAGLPPELHRPGDSRRQHDPYHHQRR